MKRRGSRSQDLSLDSLVDIVSNNVGILVILAAFMAIYSLLSQVEDEEKPMAKKALGLEKIKIPWAHHSQKTELLFIMNNNQLIYLNRDDIYEEITHHVEEQGKLPSQMEFEEFEVFLTSTSCMAYEPKPDAGKWWHEVNLSNGLMSSLLKEHRPQEFYFFFWVHSDSFELFREVRQFLWDKNFEVGWRPITENIALQFCDGDVDPQFRPQ